MHASWKLIQSTRKRLESTRPRNHEDHIGEKGFDSVTHYNLVHKFIPMPQAMKIPDAKAAVDKEGEKLEKLPAWQMTKFRTKKVILEAQKEKSPLCSTDGHLSSQKCGVGTKISKKRPSRALRRHSEDDSGSYAVFTERGSSASQMTAAKVIDVIA